MRCTGQGCAGSIAGEVKHTTVPVTAEPMFISATLQATVVYVSQAKSRA